MKKIVYVRLNICTLRAKDPYLYPGTNVLINKLGIRDAAKLSEAEQMFSLGRIVELRNNPLPGVFDEKHLLPIHKYIFQDIYDWAGKQRKIGIEKSEPILGGETVHYPHPNSPQPANNLQLRLDYAFSELTKDSYLSELSSNMEQFVSRLAHHTSELWECHPFRDGNTHATISFVYQLSEQAGVHLGLNFPEDRQSGVATC